MESYKLRQALAVVDQWAREMNMQQERLIAYNQVQCPQFPRALTSTLGLDPNRSSFMPGSKRNFKNLKSLRKIRITVHCMKMRRNHSTQRLLNRTGSQSTGLVSGEHIRILRFKGNHKQLVDAPLVSR